MCGAIAVLATDFGRGRVLLCSCHPEFTPGECVWGGTAVDVGSSKTGGLQVATDLFLAPAAPVDMSTRQRCTGTLVQPCPFCNERRLGDGGAAGGCVGGRGRQAGDSSRCTTGRRREAVRLGAAGGAPGPSSGAGAPAARPGCSGVGRDSSGSMGDCSVKAQLTLVSAHQCVVFNMYCSLIPVPEGFSRLSNHSFKHIPTFPSHQVRSGLSVYAQHWLHSQSPKQTPLFTMSAPSKHALEETLTKLVDQDDAAALASALDGVHSEQLASLLVRAAAADRRAVAELVSAACACVMSAVEEHVQKSHLRGRHADMACHAAAVQRRGRGCMRRPRPDGAACCR